MTSYKDMIVICDFDHDVFVIRNGAIDKTKGAKGRIGKGKNK